MHCTKCGVGNPENAKYCQECGMELNSHTKSRIQDIGIYKIFSNENKPLENKSFLLLISLCFVLALIHESIIWITIPLYLIFIMRYVFITKNYGYKLYILTILLLIGLEGLLLTYIYLFDSLFLKILPNLLLYSILVILTLLCLISYLHLIFTGEYKNLPTSLYAPKMKNDVSKMSKNDKVLGKDSGYKNIRIIMVTIAFIIIIIALIYNNT